MATTSAAALAVALTAAAGHAAFAADDDPITVDLTFQNRMILGAPGATNDMINTDGTAKPGTWQYPGVGAATVTVNEDLDLGADRELAGRVTIKASTLGNGFDRLNAGEEMDLWFRFFDAQNGQGGRYEADDFYKLDADTIQMTSVFAGVNQLPEGKFLDNAVVNFLTNVRTFDPDATITVEFLSVPRGSTNPFEPDVEVLGSDTATTAIINALSFSIFPSAQSVTAGETAIFESAPRTNTPAGDNYIDPDDLVVEWRQHATQNGFDYDVVGTDRILELPNVDESLDGTFYRVVYTHPESGFYVRSVAQELTVTPADETPGDDDGADEDGTGQDGNDQQGDDSGDPETNDPVDERQPGPNQAGARDNDEMPARPAKVAPSFTG